MTSNRLYGVFAVIMLVALGTVAVLAMPLLRHAATPVDAEAARLAQRHGEWFAGGPAVTTNPEIQRFVAYANGLAEQARLAQRRGEWYAGEAAVTIDPEIQRFVAYSNHLTEEARLAQRRGEWFAGSNPNAKNTHLAWPMGH